MFTQTFHLKNKGGKREREERKKGNTTSTDSLWGQRGLCCPNSGWCFLSTLLSTTLSKGLRLWTRHGRVSLSPLQTNGSLGSSGLHSEVWANCVKLGRRWELPVRNTFRVRACCRAQPPPPSPDDGLSSFLVLKRRWKLFFLEMLHKLASFVSKTIYLFLASFLIFKHMQ